MRTFIHIVELLIISTSVLSQTEEQCPGGKFPENFSFGTATNAYQVEGAWNLDGKGPSIWDTFTHDYPEKIADRSNADTSGDSYHLYKAEDIKALKMIQVDHYCFSISWPRILPDGRNINQLGIDFYNGLIDTVIENGIEPVVTMFRYDLPQALQDEGGFTNATVVTHFRKYADILFQNYGDRVKKWITFDSPSNLCTLHYSNGYLAPTVTPYPGFSGYSCGGNVLKAHASAYRLYQERYAQNYGGKIGIALVSDFYYSDTNNEYDVEKALAFEIGWFAHPIFSGKGDYPPIMREQVDKLSCSQGYEKSRLKPLSNEWIKYINASADFLGLYYYTSRMVESIDQPLDKTSDCYHPIDAFLNYTVKPEWKRAKSDYLYSVPAGLGDLTRYIKDNFNNPEVLIIRNGWSDFGEFIDLDRIEYLRAHLKELLNSILNDGCNISGYTVWSLYNSFEYREGYTAKYGLFDCNYADPRLPLTPKASAEFMRVVAATHCIPENFTIIQ